MLAGVAFVAVVAIDGLYLAIISRQGGRPPSPYVVPFVAGYVAVIALALLLSLVSPPSIKAGLRGAAAGGLFAFSALSALTIGPAVVIAALLTLVCAVLTAARLPGRSAVPAAIGGALLAITVLVAGLQLAWSQTPG